MEQINYKVQFYQDNIWEVYYWDDANQFQSCYQGSLADCEAWIRLKEQNRF